MRAVLLNEPEPAGSWLTNNWKLLLEVVMPSLTRRRIVLEPIWFADGVRVKVTE